jgi:hypothetical protein
MVHTIPPSQFRSSVPLFPSGLVLNILLVIRLLSIRMTCPAHFNLLIFMHLTKSDSSYNLYNSKLYHLLHCPLSCTVPKTLLRIFLPNSPSALSSAFVSVQVSEAYVATGLTRTLYNVVFVFLEISLDLKCFLSP